MERWRSFHLKCALLFCLILAALFSCSVAARVRHTKDRTASHALHSRKSLKVRSAPLVINVSPLPVDTAKSAASTTVERRNLDETGPPPPSVTKVTNQYPPPPVIVTPSPPALPKPPPLPPIPLASAKSRAAVAVGRQLNRRLSSKNASPDGDDLEFSMDYTYNPGGPRPVPAAPKGRTPKIGAPPGPGTEVSPPPAEIVTSPPPPPSLLPFPPPLPIDLPPLPFQAPPPPG
ncbi:hypothetical protein R1sor_013584 [Riccia sorocarpa]|uniref:Uncharacterized protein n=1 Tax=Riccia sorocarpa TaxID=122646 RepID=A0ABD3HAK0_9MARC